MSRFTGAAGEDFTEFITNFEVETHFIIEKYPEAIKTTAKANLFKKCLDHEAFSYYSSLLKVIRAD